jgi:hypothetical protein
MEIYGTAPICASGKNNLRETLLLYSASGGRNIRAGSVTSLFVYTQDLTPKQKFGAQPKAAVAL